MAITATPRTQSMKSLRCTPALYGEITLRCNAATRLTYGLREPLGR